MGYLAPRYYGQCQSATTSTVVKALLVPASLVKRRYTKYIGFTFTFTELKCKFMLAKSLESARKKMELIAPVLFELSCTHSKIVTYIHTYGRTEVLVTISSASSTGGDKYSREPLIINL